MDAFTLDELAWFNRCFFPMDAHDMLISVGASEFDAYAVMSYLKANPKAGILGVYQEFITDSELTSKLNQLVNKFLGR